MSMGKRVALRREALGMTQGEVARRMHADGHLWHQPTVVRVEAGERPVRASELRSLGDVLGLALRDLVGQSEHAPLRQWPRTSTVSPDADEVCDHLGRRWAQVYIDQWVSADGTFTLPFAFLAEHYGPLREVAS